MRSDATARRWERLLHLPVDEAAGAETMLEDALGRAVEVGAEVCDADVLELVDVACTDEDADSEEEGEEPPLVEPPEANATGGAGSVNEWKLSSQMSGNWTSL